MKLVYFAWVRERVGKSEEELDPPPEVATVGDLIAWLSTRGEGYAYAFEKPSTVRAALDKFMPVTTRRSRARRESPSFRR